MHSEPAFILVIDDHESVRFTLSEILTFAGWQVETAASGWAGLARFRARRHDLVIVDYHMPDATGSPPCAACAPSTRTSRSSSSPSRNAPTWRRAFSRRAPPTSPSSQSSAGSDLARPPPPQDARPRCGATPPLRRARRGKGHLPHHAREDPRLPARASPSRHPGRDHPSTALAYPTVHRYVQYLEETGRVVAEYDYGKVGRPRKRYRILRP